MDTNFKNRITIGNQQFFSINSLNFSIIAAGVFLVYFMVCFLFSMPAWATEKPIGECFKGTEVLPESTKAACEFLKENSPISINIKKYNKNDWNNCKKNKYLCIKFLAKRSPNSYDLISGIDADLYIVDLQSTIPRLYKPSQDTIKPEDWITKVQHFINIQINNYLENSIFLQCILMVNMSGDKTDYMKKNEKTMYYKMPENFNKLTKDYKLLNLPEITKFSPCDLKSLSSTEINTINSLRYRTEIILKIDEENENANLEIKIEGSNPNNPDIPPKEMNDFSLSKINTATQKTAENLIETFKNYEIQNHTN